MQLKKGDSANLVLEEACGSNTCPENELWITPVPWVDWNLRVPLHRISLDRTEYSRAGETSLIFLNGGHGMSGLFRLKEVQERKSLDLYLLTRLRGVVVLCLELFLVGGNMGYVRETSVSPAWKK